jgi:hypothetical protein
MRVESWNGSLNQRIVFIITTPSDELCLIKLHQTYVWGIKIESGKSRMLTKIPHVAFDHLISQRSAQYQGLWFPLWFSTQSLIQ